MFVIHPASSLGYQIKINHKKLSVDSLVEFHPVDNVPNAAVSAVFIARISAAASKPRGRGTFPWLSEEVHLH